MKERDKNKKRLYQNHYYMKQQRLIKLQQVKGKCEICGEKANCIHHKDGSVNNHDLENLIVLCQSCHVIIHKPEGDSIVYQAHCEHGSKFIRLYGMTLHAISNKLGRSYTYYYDLHRKGLLKDYLIAKKILKR